MKRRIIFVLSLLLTLAVLAAIFGFSAQTAEESNGLSKALARAIAELMPWITKKMTVRRLNRLLRKAAHFTLYFLLGCGLTGILRTSRKPAAALLAVPLGALCAAMDEAHQSFVPGRGPGIWDVLLDTCGVAAAALLIALLLALFEKKRRARGGEP